MFPQKKHTHLTNFKIGKKTYKVSSYQLPSIHKTAQSLNLMNQWIKKRQPIAEKIQVVIQTTSGGPTNPKTRSGFWHFEPQNTITLLTKFQSKRLGRKSQEDCEIFHGTYCWLCLCAVSLCSFKLTLGMSQIPSNTPKPRQEPKLRSTMARSTCHLQWSCLAQTTHVSDSPLPPVHNGSGSEGRVGATTSKPVAFVAGASFLGVGMCFLF